MKFLLFLIMLGLTPLAFSLSIYETDYTYRNSETQKKLEEMQWQLQQAESKRQAERAEFEAAAEVAVEEAAEEARQEAERTAQEAEDRVREAREQAEQEAEDLRNEILRSSIKSKNNIYFGIMLFALGSFFYFISKNKGKQMDDNQKYGIVTMIVSVLLAILALMISVGWTPQLDYLENLMNTLSIKLFQYEVVVKNAPFGDLESYGTHLEEKFRFVMSTKYAVLLFMSTFSYGLTTYLGITPAIKPWK